MSDDGMSLVAIAIATGDRLDLLAKELHLPERNPGESDAAYRERLKDPFDPRDFDPYFREERLAKELAALRAQVAELREALMDARKFVEYERQFKGVQQARELGEHLERIDAALEKSGGVK
jgi:hypothetical protein